MYFTIYRDTQNQYRWNLKGNNHEPVASGEGYLQKAGVLHAVALVNGKNGYPVHDHTLGLLDSALAHIASNGLGLPAARPSSFAAFGINPANSPLAGLLGEALKK